MPKADTGIAKDQITAVIVTYNPDLSILSTLVDSLRPQVHSIVIVDNHSACDKEIEAFCLDINCILLSANSGLGFAHNLGIEFAKNQSSEYVLLLDQDSLPDPDMVEKLLATANHLKQLNVNYSAVGSRYRSGNGNPSDFVKIDWFRFSRIACDSSSYVKADFLISSGALFPLSVFESVGLMDESLFIDHIDTEWFIRASGLGFQAYGCCDAFMSHCLGERVAKIWFGRWRNVPYHQPFRYYYIFRNSFSLYRRSYMTKKWMVTDLVRLGQIFVYFGMFSKNLLINQKMIWQGLIDGMMRRGGRNDRLMSR